MRKLLFILSVMVILVSCNEDEMEMVSTNSTVENKKVENVNVSDILLENSINFHGDVFYNSDWNPMKIKIENYSKTGPIGPIWSPIHYATGNKVKIGNGYPNGVPMTFSPTMAAMYGLTPGTYYCDIYSYIAEKSLPTNAIAVEATNPTPVGYIDFDPWNGEVRGVEY